MPLHKKYDKLMNFKIRRGKTLICWRRRVNYFSPIFTKIHFKQTPWVHLDIVLMAFSKYKELKFGATVLEDY